MSEINKFSKTLWNNIVNFQATGGNISMKDEDTMKIKSSGYKISDIYSQNIISEIAISKSLTQLGESSSDINLANIIEENNTSEYRSSMETGFHLLLDTYVIHTHNVYINVLLCMENPDNIITELFADDVDVFEYLSPWFWLFQALKEKRDLKQIIFLKNHGIIVHGDTSFEDLQIIIDNIEQKIKNYFWLKIFQLVKDISKIEQHIFPDSIICPDNIEIYSAHVYIESSIKKLWKRVKYLQKGEIDYINSMDAEKYRKNLLTNA